MSDGNDITRREALARTAILLGGTLAASTIAGAQSSTAWLSPSTDWRPGTLADPQLDLVAAIADHIIPRTDTPGAVDVGAPEFVDLLVDEWYADSDKTALLRGLDALTARCQTAHGQPIAGLDAGARTAFALSIDGQRGDPGSAEWAYARIKDTVIFAFLTSEPISKLTSTMPIRPGRFDGCVPL